MPPPLAPARLLGSDPSWASHQAWKLSVGTILFTLQKLRSFFSIICKTVRPQTDLHLLSLSTAAPALRTPLSIAGSYPTPFAMMGHHEMNGGLTSPGVYAGLHISPQMSAAAAAAYGRTPMVKAFPFLFCSFGSSKSHVQDAMRDFTLITVEYVSQTFPYHLLGV